MSTSDPYILHADPYAHSSTPRTLTRYDNSLARFKQPAGPQLLSDTGVLHRRRRLSNVAAVFGNIKQNKAVPASGLEAQGQVTIEAGLIIRTYNLTQIAKISPETLQRSQSSLMDLSVGLPMKTQI